MTAQITIFNDYQGLVIKPDGVKQLVEAILKAEGFVAESINVIFVTDDFLRIMHRDFLDDNTLTDVITFNLSESGLVDGEIYISVDRAEAHARTFNVTIGEELARLIIHGMLHLKGYDDQTAPEQQKMRLLENRYLQQFSGMVVFEER